MSRSSRRRYFGVRQPQITLLSSLLFVFAGFVMTVMLWSLTPMSLAQSSQLSTRPALWAQRPMESQNWVQPPLTTRGSDIVDRTGRSLLLRGVNWFGFETQDHVVHGLWKRNYKELIAQVKDLGYNFIRLPYSVQMVLRNETRVNGMDVNLNPDLKDKKPLEVMDAIIQEAGRQGIMILLDSHRLNDQTIPALWYGDGFTEQDWIAAWTNLATRYKDQPNVIGADLKNEPHGIATWGTGDRKTDWRLAAERAGNAILSVNPNWLIVVEGIENGMLPKQVLKAHWMGGNLENVKSAPVRLNRSARVVYSPHEYGQGVYNQPWFSEPSFPNNLLDRWEKGFHFIARTRIAPVLIGEFGGRKTDTASKEGIWQNTLVRYIKDKRLHFAYWSLNPNSQDTGGILNDDWVSVDPAKKKMLEALLPAARMRN